MDKLKLGKLEKVKLRDVWKHEALSFTKWLAKEENILNLSEEIGIDIEVVKTEASVGNFNVDILAREVDSDRKIIIENQLEKTDHDHLGKLITYASGHAAQIILWIVGEAREEHEKAIEWLNENMNEDIKFFLIVIEVWKIGDSPYAPKFQVVSEPNNWAKTIKSASNKGELTDTKSLQLEFWTKFNEFIEGKVSFNSRKPRPQHWYDISYGNSHSHISLAMDTRNNFLNVDVYIPDNVELFKKLLEKKEEIEKQINFSLDWRELPERKACRISHSIMEFDLQNKSNWTEFYSEMIDKVEKLKLVFSKYVNKY